MLRSKKGFELYSSEPMPPTDFESFEEACLRQSVCRLSLMRAAREGRFDSVDVVRTALWYYEIEGRLQVTTPYQLERRLEPEAFGKNVYGDAYHRNKWIGYRVGRHRPNARLIDRVEAQVPGSRHLINHPVWEALRGKRGWDWWRTAGFQQLSTEIRAVLYKTNRYSHDETLVTQLSRPLLRRLECRAGLDALATLIVFLHRADEQNDRKQAFAIGTSIYRMLLMISTALPFRELDNELLLLFRQRVFPLAHNGRVGIVVDEEAFHQAAGLLLALFLALEDQGKVGSTAREITQTLFEFFRGYWGMDLQCALYPPLALVVPEASARREDREFIAESDRARQWGWQTVHHGAAPKDPPEGPSVRNA